MTAQLPIEQWQPAFRNRVADAKARLDRGEDPEEIREIHGKFVLHAAREMTVRDLARADRDGRR